MYPKTMIGLILFGIFAMVGLGVLLSTFEIINAGERGIVVNLGRPEEILDEGFHTVNPITKSIVVMNVQVQKYEAESAASSKDLQTVTSKVALNYHLDPAMVMQLYSKIGTRDMVVQKIVDPAIQESVKAATANFTAEELISKRALVKEQIKIALTERLNSSSIIVDELSIVNFDFSRDFNAAIEAKQVAEQQAQKAKNELERVKFEAQQQIETAKAQSESTRLQVEALKQGSQIVELRKVEVMLEAAKRWNGVLPVNIYGSTPLPLINVTP